MLKEDPLFEACRILFGEEIELSREFLLYIQHEGVTSAFRRKAMQVHPDRALVSGLSAKECQDQFISLKYACGTLLQHIVSRDNRSSLMRPETNRRNGSTAASAIILPGKKLLFGRFLYRMGIIEWGQLITALAWQKSSRLKIGELGIKFGYLDRNAVITILQNTVRGKLFGMTAQHMGFLTKDEVSQLLMKQKWYEKKIGQYFVEQGLLSRSELNKLLVEFRTHNRRADQFRK
ncbi:MAG: hypothetical protein WBB23_07720 [Desulforhopalus sp.]